MAGARAALAEPACRRRRVAQALACAVLMAVAAAALCAVILLGGQTPNATEPASEVRGALRR